MRSLVEGQRCVASCAPRGPRELDSITPQNKLNRVDILGAMMLFSLDKTMQEVIYHLQELAYQGCSDVCWRTC